MTPSQVFLQPGGWAHRFTHPRQCRLPVRLRAHARVYVCVCVFQVGGLSFITLL